MPTPTETTETARPTLAPAQQSRADSPLAHALRAVRAAVNEAALEVDAAVEATRVPMV